MASIRKETPTGDINGVNKVFTLLNTPVLIDDIFVDGAIYVSYSLSGNILTLTDAPTLTINVDYETTDNSSATGETICTFGDIKEEVWDLLIQKPNSTNFSDTKVGKKINIVSRAVWKGSVRNLLNPNQILRAGDLSFQETDIGFSIKNGGILTAELNVGDSIAELDTTYLLDSGYVQIGGDTISYTSKTDTQIQGIAGQTTTHAISANVVQLYEMPNDFDKPKKVEFIAQTSVLTSYEIPFDNGNPTTVYYSVITTGTTKLLKVSGLDNNDMVSVKYSQKIFDLVNDTDICQFPDDYGISVIAAIVAGEMGFNKKLPLSQELLTNGYASLQEMYGYYNSEIKIVKQKITAKAYGFNSIRRY